MFRSNSKFVGFSVFSFNHDITGWSELAATNAPIRDEAV
jgi:hypothetical protein